jgi:hypothetical protein
MPNKTLLISTLTEANPYVIGSAPDNLTGYTQPTGSDSMRVGTFNGQKSIYLSGSTESMWLDDTILTGATVYSRVTLPAIVGGASAGAVLADINGTGHEVIFGASLNNFRVFATLNGKLTGSALSGGTYSVPPAANGVVELSHAGTTLTVKQNGVTLGSVTGITRPTDVRAGMSSRGGQLVALESEYAAAQSITSINGGSPITVGQTGVVIEHTGFTGAATAVTTNRAGVTATITAGDASSTTVSVSGWAEGVEYPVVDNTVTFTVSRVGESASGNQTLTKPANYDKVTFASAIIDDENLIGFHLNVAGHTVEGGSFYYRNDQVATLTVLPDTDWTADPAGGTFESWFIPATGSTAGEAYRFDVTVINGSIASAPIMPADTSVTVPVGTTNLGTFAATSGSAPITYSLSGANAGLFTINSSAVVTAVGALSEGTGSIIVTATNSVGSDSMTVSYEVEVTEPTITSVATIRINGTSAVTVGGFDSTINAGTLDAIALTSASDTSITVKGLIDTQTVPRLGSQTLTLTDGTGSANKTVDVLPPAGFGYIVAASYQETINGIAASYLPVTATDGHFIIYPKTPSAGKTTKVTNAGISTSHVGDQTLWIVNATTKVARSFVVTTTASAGLLGGGGFGGVGSLGIGI